MGEGGGERERSREFRERNYCWKRRENIFVIFIVLRLFCFPIDVLLLSCLVLFPITQTSYIADYSLSF